MAQALVQEQHMVVEPAESDGDNVQRTRPAGKVKGALIKVKHKARKLKDKMKKATHTGNGVHATDEHKHYREADERQRDQGRLHSSTLISQHEEASSSDEYDSDNDCNDGAQLRYERLRSFGATEKLQGNGSNEVEVHDGVPANASTLGGAYWKSVNDSSPGSTDDSAAVSRPTNTVPDGDHVPIESDNSEATTMDDLQAAYEGSFDRAQSEMGEFESGRTTHDQIRVFSEDLSTDRKLAIDHSDKNTAGDSEQRDSVGGVNTALGNGSPIASPFQDGASEQMYRPVKELDDFPSASTSESLYASLYGDVLAAEDKLNLKGRGAKTGDDYPSDHSEKDFSFDKDKLLKMQAPALEKSERENTFDEAEVEDIIADKNNDGMEAQEKIADKNAGHGLETQEKIADKNDDGSQVQEKIADKNDDGQMSNTERWGKWSADKLNNVVDGLALQLGDGATTENNALQKTKSDVDYFDPNNLDDKKFAEQFAFGGGDDANQEDGFLDGALAGSAVVVEKLQELKDTITSTLGYGSARPSEGPHRDGDGPHRDGDEHLDNEQSQSLNEGGEDEKQVNEQQPGFFQGFKEAVASSFGLDSASLGPTDEQSEESDAPLQPAGTDSNVEDGKSTKGANLSHEWSLGSASDVPQAAFL